MLEVRQLGLDGVLEIVPKRHGDARGYFIETWNAEAFAETGLRVIRGKILDVAVDIRRSSKTFGKWVALEISAERGNQILVPKGFAHGFVTLVPDTEVLYKVTDTYSPAHDRSIRFDDPDIGIDWPSPAGAFELSAKDLKASALAEAEVFA
ncbi:dTDP-4-dehydrorhamnose 3,5-epimerase [Mesorhizobium sp. LNJC372A00]|uniref:dTDP-4-dehydrorhamnose 3,5-epimerase family protein n=1 Tax=Mesorhizobium sp. LNJC372A00 TaxID=1287256 RepID=UPI0003CED484|nr:dTDP-4-dehydrorhamnose 3,5-epimerase [Mesorhizobium sp. LNJC372A00]ESY59710.1 dTDP-4-dehydrorhamnose 3,5-epimerase [Mesorhizobium sp. LNJC372A00]